MRRYKHESPISLFSFQDIIMSVVGVVILITLLLILKLITQPPTSSVSTISARELREQIESLSPVLLEIQNEIEQQNKHQIESTITPQTKDQIDALIYTIKRIDAECVELDKAIQNAKLRSESLKNDLKSKTSPNNKEQIKKMKEQLDQLKTEMDELTVQEKKLQATATELTLKKQEWEKKITVVQQLNVTVQKSSDKKAFICVYGEDGLTVIPTDGTPQKKFTSQSEFYQWVDSRNNKTEHFVIYFRPSRFGRYKEILDRIRVKGFAVGSQVIGETTNLINNNEP
ncbi:MAG: hypothetical protein LBH59_09585 [Planctomycetaceae bacterium]|nr:hypothetical protein [Planctomycetaceae bacterium]